MGSSVLTLKKLTTSRSPVAGSIEMILFSGQLPFMQPGSPASADWPREAYTAPPIQRSCLVCISATPVPVEDESTTVRRFPVAISTSEMRFQPASAPLSSRTYITVLPAHIVSPTICAGGVSVLPLGSEPLVLGLPRVTKLM